MTDACGVPLEESFKYIAQDPAYSETDDFSRHLADGVWNHKSEIDAMLTRYAENWDLHRMAAVDRNILRLSTFEIVHDKETPLSVIIDEAIEIAKTYSTEESGKFVNGILDKIKQERKS